MNLTSLPLPDIQGQHKGDHQGSVAAQEVRRLGNWVKMRWMKMEPIIESDISQKEKHQYINAYIWNLERS